MEYRAALTEGDIDDINEVLEESVKAIRFYIKRGEREGCSEVEMQSMKALLAMHEQALTLSDEGKLAFYRMFAKAINRDVVRRFGESDDTKAVDQLLAVN